VSQGFVSQGFVCRKGHLVARLWLLGVDEFSTGEALLASNRQGGSVCRASERAMKRHNSARRAERSCCIQMLRDRANLGSERTLSLERYPAIVKL
jgi:hypothetical protein